MNPKPGHLAAVIIGLSSLHAVFCSGELKKPSLNIPPYTLLEDFADFKCRLPERHAEVLQFKFYRVDNNMQVGEWSLQPYEEDAKIIVEGTLANQGYFVCRAAVQNDTSVTSLDSDRVYFRVVVPVQQVELTLRPKLGKIFESDDLTLSCEVQGGVNISYTWLRDSSALEVSSNPLHIGRVTQRDAGTYSCMARSGIDLDDAMTSNNITVEVKEMLSPPKITFSVRKDQDRYFAEITCRTDRASLPANFSLHIYNETSKEFITMGASHSLSASFSEQISLGRSTERAQCLVTDGHSVLKSDSIPLEVVPVGGAVHIHLEYDLGHNFELVGVTLQCTAERGTHPIYRWYLNDSLLNAESKSQFYDLSNDRRSITILDIQTATNYRCEVANEFDSSFNASSKLLLINQDVLRNHVPTEVKALILGCSLLLVVLLTGCCIYGAKYPQRQPQEKIQPPWFHLDTDVEENEKEEELVQEDYEEDLDVVRAANMDEEDEADVDSVEDWIETE